MQQFKVGGSALHGTHQVAQKSIKTTLPFNSLNLIGLSSKSNNAKSGARVPTRLREAPSRISSRGLA
jgi:hypothetical protein